MLIAGYADAAVPDINRDCEVVVAGSDDGALASLPGCDRQPDLIIADYQLAGGKTGFKAIDRLRKPRSSASV